MNHEPAFCSTNASQNGIGGPPSACGEQGRFRLVIYKFNGIKSIYNFPYCECESIKHTNVEERLRRAHRQERIARSVSRLYDQKETRMQN